MRTDVVLTFLTLTVFSDPTTSFPADIVPVTPRKQGEISIDKDRFHFEQYFVNEEKPAVPDYTCAHELPYYISPKASHSPCLQGYARHSNGRCYRVVDKTQDGDDVSKHEYRFTYKEECEFNQERTVSDLGPLETLDFCDEYGGCGRSFSTQSYSGGIIRTECVQGHKRDGNRNCLKLVTNKDERRRPTQAWSNPN